MPQRSRSTRPLTDGQLDELVRALREDFLTTPLAERHGFDGVFDCVGHVMEQLGLTVPALDLDSLLTVTYPQCETVQELASELERQTTYAYRVPLGFVSTFPTEPVVNPSCLRSSGRVELKRAHRFKPWVELCGTIENASLSLTRTAISEAALVWGTQLIVRGLAEDASAFGSFNLRGGPGDEFVCGLLGPTDRPELQYPPPNTPLASHVQLRPEVLSGTGSLTLHPPLDWWLERIDHGEEQTIIVAALRAFGLALSAREPETAVVHLGSCLETLYAPGGSGVGPKIAKNSKQDTNDEETRKLFRTIYDARCAVVHGRPYRLTEAERLRGIQQLLLILEARFKHCFAD